MLCYLIALLSELYVLHIFSIWHEDIYSPTHLQVIYIFYIAYVFYTTSSDAKLSPSLP